MEREYKSAMLNQVLKVKRDWTNSPLRATFEPQKLKKIDKLLQRCEEDVKSGVVSSDVIGHNQLMHRLLVFTMHVFTLDEIDYFVAEMLMWQRKMMTSVDNFIANIASVSDLCSAEKKKEYGETMWNIKQDIARGKFESNARGEKKLEFVLFTLFFALCFVDFAFDVNK